MEDNRFDTSKDPRFRRAPKTVRRVKVDERFASMFTDKRFVETAKVDKHGRKVKAGSEKLKLREFYELAGVPESEIITSEKRIKKKVKRKPVDHGESGNEGSDDQNEKIESSKREDARCEESDIASKDGDCSDVAEDDEGDDEDEGAQEGEEEEEEDDEDNDEALPSEAWERDDGDVPKGDATKRLVLMGCDWDRVSAGDLLVMLRTYLSSAASQKSGSALRSGSVDRVRVYPSDYGIQKLAEEAKAGPGLPGEPATQPPVSVEDEGEEGDPAQNEAMRLYQLQRTKYYYAVAECDSVATATWLYDELDSMEADGICFGMLDARFAPDDLEFPHAPTSEATEVPKRYQAPIISGKTSLGHTKVQCTWDETPAKRKRDLMCKRFSASELRDADLQAYLASSSEDEDKDAGDAQALRSLVLGEDDEFGSGGKEGFPGSDGSDSDAQPVEGDMEATFSMSATKLEEELTERVKKQDGKRVHTFKGEAPAQKSVWEQYLEKKKLKRKERKAEAKAARQARKDGKDGQESASEDEAGNAAETPDADLELLASTGDADDDRGFNFRGKKRGRGGQAKASSAAEEGEFKVDVEDPRIAKVFSSADFEIDPTNPEFRTSQGMQAVLKKKRARKFRSTAAAQPAQTGNTISANGSGPGAASSRAAAPAPAPAPAAAVDEAAGLRLFAPRKRGPEATESEGSRRPQVSERSTDGRGKKKKKKQSPKLL
eukprot:TRINITY_DN860_c0_g1_i1.p1 TRINITY_DN860_c0_g1~~TRINITY_DN860_c0_g1_i1.p1  ORF type:complete len:718 (+),score=185.67 TRINITY_DN860_c0_g1_i1:71-2224(+)